MEKDSNYRAWVAEIDDLTRQLRALFGLDFDRDFNIVSLLENSVPEILPDFSLQVLPTKSLGAIEAFTEHDPLRIVAREDVYQGANSGNARDRFTLAHELGHLFLHPSLIARMRLQVISTASRNVPFETEANTFAASFLMPESLVRTFYNPQELSYHCKVSLAAAERRMRELNLWPKRNEAVVRGFEELLAYLKRPPGTNKR